MRALFFFIEEVLGGGGVLVVVWFGMSHQHGETKIEGGWTEEGEVI